MAVSLDGELEMSQRCDFKMRMSVRHDNLDVKIEVSRQGGSRRREVNLHVKIEMSPRDESRDESAA